MLQQPIDRKLAVEKINAVIRNLDSVIKGKDEVIRFTLTAFIAGGHILYEDLPGTGKSILAEALALSMRCSADGNKSSFSRIQGTPDLMPGDVTGISIYNPKTQEFEPRLGPVATANIALADEINRTPPKVNSALLEVMYRKTVSIDGKWYHVPEPFLVLATQNPIEQDGTFVLPEALLDRFLMRLSLGYPDKEAELQMLASQKNHHPIHDLKPVITDEEIIQIQKALTYNPSEGGLVFIHELLEEYIVDIVNATRYEAEKPKNERRLEFGSSPRGSLALRDAARAYAFMNNREFVVPQDIKALAVPILAHRVGINIRNITLSASTTKAAEKIIRDIAHEVPAPSDKDWNEPQLKFK